MAGLSFAKNKLLSGSARARATKEPCQKPHCRPTGCSDHRAASGTTNPRTTPRPGCRSDRAPYGCATSDLPALALTRSCAGIFGHLATLVDIPLSYLLTDLL